MSKLISVIIPNINRRSLLEKCLNGVFRQSYKPIEVIVIDNASTDGAPEMVKSRFPMIKLIENKTNIGAAEARNQGIRLSKGAYLWFLDNDSLCEDNGVLQRMVDYLEGHPDAGCAGGELRYDTQGNCIGVKGFDIRPNGEAVMKIHACEGVCECDYFDTLNLLARRDIVYRIGGFDSYYIYLAEDKDLCFKIKKAGYKIVVGREFGVRHFRSDEKRPPSNAYRRLLQRNRLRFVLLNCAWEQIALTMAYDFAPFFNPRRFLIEGGPLFFGKLQAQVYAYWWNILNLPRTLRLRFEKKQFLE